MLPQDPIILLSYVNTQLRVAQDVAAHGHVHHA